MDEEIKTIEEKPAAADTGEGIQSETDKKVAALNADTERINRAIAENANAKARQMLGGQSEAGQQVPEKKEDTPAEYTAKVLSGEIQAK